MLKQKTTTTRNRFTSVDLDFLASVLVPGEQRPHVEKLWTDPDALRGMLDLPEVFRSLLNSPETLRISPRFYFYILVRHAFLQANLRAPEVADYVSDVMTRSVSPAHRDPLCDVARGFTHASEFIAFINRAQGRMRFHLQVAAGNQFLMLAGLYPGFLSGRRAQSGAQDPGFYQNFAQQAFRDAAASPHAPSPAARTTLAHLAESLPLAIRSLNRVADEYVFLGD